MHTSKLSRSTQIMSMPPITSGSLSFVSNDLKTHCMHLIGHSKLIQRTPLFSISGELPLFTFTTMLKLQRIWMEYWHNHPRTPEPYLTRGSPFFIFYGTRKPLFPLMLPSN